LFKPTKKLAVISIFRDERIVRYFVCRTAQRSARRRRHSELSASTPVLAEVPLANEALEHLDACLLKLPDRQRAAVTLHYLAGKSAEEIAFTLGITRDHAYQLISRGLAALRTHLTRRGIRVGSVVLASWLATEARAATMPVDLTETFFQPSTAPTPGAEYLAQGALKTMTISSLTSIATNTAAAAGLLLTAGILTLTFAAEPVPPKAGTGAATPASTMLAPELQKALNLSVSCSFQDASMTEVAAWLSKTSAAIVVDPKVVASNTTIAFNGSNMRLEDVLMMIERMAGLTHVIVDHKIYRIDLPKP
jgi:hypothetical protein